MKLACKLLSTSWFSSADSKQETQMSQAERFLLRVPRILLYQTSLRTNYTASKPIITAPIQDSRKLRRVLEDKHIKNRLTKSQQGNTKVCIISCKNHELNHYLGQSYGKFDSIPLASKGWAHRRSNGDYFVINSHGKNPSLLENDEDFQTLGLDEAIIKGLQDMGHTRPTLIQKLAIKHVLRGENCLIAAETGSGKTLSYLVPLINNIYLQKTLLKTNLRPPNAPAVIVMTPGRELCEQIHHVCQQLSQNIPVISHAIVGGSTKKKMLNPDMQDLDILIGSFGVLSKLFTTKVYDTSHVHALVLDEADSLLDDSFNEKVAHFLGKFPLQMTMPHNGPEGVQTILASATMPRSADQILKDVLPFGSFSKITTSHLHRILPHVPQKFIRLSHLDKAAKLLELVKKDVTRNLPVIVFSNRSERCDWISMFLNENGIPCVNLNGAMSQRIRQDRYEQFAKGKKLVLSCTDVVSRGLDTVNNHHVINFDVPTNMSDYVHRCGRVGRVGSHHASGIVTTLVCNPTEAELVQKIEFAARKMSDDLPNVNANIKRILNMKDIRQLESDLKNMS